MNCVWIVFDLTFEEYCTPVIGAFESESDAAGFGTWCLAFKDGIEKVQVTRYFIAPPGSMYPPETVH